MRYIYYIVEQTSPYRFSSYKALATTATNAGVDLVTWEVENSAHIEHMFNDPEGYEARLIAFFDKHLNN